LKRREQNHLIGLWHSTQSFVVARYSLFWVVTQWMYVVFTEVSGESIPSMFKGLLDPWRWDNMQFWNVVKKLPTHAA